MANPRTLDEIRARGQAIDAHLREMADEMARLEAEQADLQQRVSAALQDLAARLGIEVTFEPVDGTAPRRRRRRTRAATTGRTAESPALPPAADAAHPAEDHNAVLQQIERALQSEGLDGVVTALHRAVARYDWVGFYLLNDQGTELVLGPFQGVPTCHTAIPLDQGICGGAATARETLILADVRADPRYLECSPQTRSEIVVPLLDGDRCLGVLDIDSDQPAAFDARDQALLEAVAQRCASCLANARAADVR